MREGQTIDRIRLRLLALVLALALTWYALNPVPGPGRRVKRDEEPPDEKRREAKSLAGVSYGLELMEAGAAESTTDLLAPVMEANIDDLEWPEVIDLR